MQIYSYWYNIDSIGESMCCIIVSTCIREKCCRADDSNYVGSAQRLLNPWTQWTPFFLGNGYPCNGILISGKCRWPCGQKPEVSTSPHIVLWKH